MDLSAVETDALLQELNGRARHGIAALYCSKGGRVDVWWGDRVTCLGLAARLSYSVQRELDDLEDAEDESPDEDEDEEDEAQPPPLPIGQYL